MNTERIMVDEPCRTKVHFTDNDLLNPTNPISVNVIGAGGTGSQVITALARMNHALQALEHPGLFIRLWDDDIITEANLGRQLFAVRELQTNKAVALINRINRFFGTNWKAETGKFEKDHLDRLPENARASIFISCLDSVKARFEIADLLNRLNNNSSYSDHPRYWLDFGNSQHTGQVVLSTIGTIRQPNSKKYETAGTLPFVTEEFGELLTQSEASDNTPSCSLAEALEKQDLFINSSLAQMGCSLLWGMFRNGLTPYRGFFLNLKDFRSQPIPVA